MRPSDPSLARRAESLPEIVGKLRRGAMATKIDAPLNAVKARMYGLCLFLEEVADELEALSRPSAPAWQPSARVLELATKAARYNHFELRHNGFQHGGHDALFETCPHPDCASVRPPLPSGPETRA